MMRTHSSMITVEGPGWVGLLTLECLAAEAFPAKHYRSDPNNWTLTEPAIYYNAPLVFLSGYFAQRNHGE